MTSRGVAALAVLALGAAGCVESATHEKTVAELNQARQAAWQRDQRVRALEWQIAIQAQQLEALAQRAEVTQRELAGQVAELTAQNAALAERVKKEESRNSALAAALEDPRDPRARPGAAGAGRASAEDLRRLQLLVEARNTRVIEALGRIEKQLQDRAHLDARPGAHPRPAGDVVDPWGFGERK